MQLIELIMAAVVFSGAASCSLQLWGQAASGAHRAEHLEQLQQRIELDRLQLQAHWQRLLSAAPVCSSAVTEIVSIAAALPLPPQVQRRTRVDDHSAGVWVHWQATDTPGLERERLFTAAGLGFCPPEPSDTGASA